MTVVDSTLEQGISVIVPVYNSEGTLPALIDRLRVVLADAVPCFEVILVDDGSRDRSWPVVEELSAQFPWVRGIHLARNYGQHNALLCGIRTARYTVTVTIDDDLQNPPEEIPRLLAVLGDGYDVVYGTPEREQHGLWRDLASRMTKLALQNAMGQETARKVSAFRAFRTRVRAAFTSYQNPFVSIDVLLTWGTTRFTALPVAHRPRTIGTSNYTLRKLVVHALNMVTGFSTLPLQLASVLGFLMTLFGVGVLIYVLINYLRQHGNVPVAGFTFLASIISIFSGAQLLALGIIGEYLARMHFRMLERPSYVVATSTELGQAGDEVVLIERGSGS
ncbi:MAG TPA: glycosyltransferase family 2 protein [Armatimonadota bacterium]|jgi:undecaprenyl-phosphate 4-deoxy-4-formamido-L-arabinose transferase